jgi:putative membrane protein
MVQVQNVRNAQVGRSWMQGGLAGFIATGPMSVFMLATQRLLPKRQQYALPPEIITEELAHRMHIRWHMNKKQVEGATLVSHFGYGAAMGTLYGLLAMKIPLPPPIKGVLFGLVVWAGSYLGMLPLSGMSESGQREQGRRNLMMIAAHVVWGSTLGVLSEFFAEKIL